MGTHEIPAASPNRRNSPGLLVVAGAGLIGSRLADMAQDSGWKIRILHRSGSGRAPQEDLKVDASGREHAWWAPAERLLPPGALEGARAVVCLSGAPIAPHPWTPARRRVLATSRLSTTALIAQVAAGLPPAVRPGVLLSGSATGFYGNRGDEILDETCGPGEGFLSELCQHWEAAAGPAARVGLRTIQSRTGLVVSPSGGLGKILGTAYRVGAGARLGRGDQWQPWIGLDDAAAALLWAIEHDDVCGPVNLTAPEPLRNRDLHRLLSHSPGPPSPAVVPQFLLDRARRTGATGGTSSIGSMLAELLGASQRAVPQALLASGFRFAAPSAASIWGLGA